MPTLFLALLAPLFPPINHGKSLGLQAGSVKSHPRFFVATQSLCHTHLVQWQLRANHVITVTLSAISALLFQA